jgi:hypothetical protein
VASERQIAANQRNARKSTGPRSWAGKKRASRNSYRHGLSLSVTSSAAFAKQLHTLARKIAGRTKDAVQIEHARSAAQAELVLARVRRAKVALIERVCALEDPDALPVFSSDVQPIQLVETLRRQGFTSPEPVDPSTTTPSQEPDRLAEAVRRVLPELLRLDRYERRASARRDQALRQLFGRDRSKYNL